MPPKKKAAGGGDAAKGEKVFKNLCSACHSLSVSLLILLFQQKLNKSNCRISIGPLNRSRPRWNRWKQHRIGTRFQLLLSSRR